MVKACGVLYKPAVGSFRSWDDPDLFIGFRVEDGNVDGGCGAADLDCPEDGSGVGNFHSVGNCSGGNWTLIILTLPRNVPLSDMTSGTIHLESHPRHLIRTFSLSYLARICW